MKKIDTDGYREKKDLLDIQEDNKRKHNTIKANYELYPNETLKEQFKTIYEHYINGVKQNA
jgi:hypothetical protein